jgi:hypothetical protein
MSGISCEFHGRFSMEFESGRVLILLVDGLQPFCFDFHVRGMIYTYSRLEYYYLRRLMWDI